MTRIRSIFALAAIFLFMLFPPSVSGKEGQTDPPPPGEDESEYWKIMRRAEEGVRGPIADWHWYWKDGLRIDSPEKNFTMKINLSVFVDGGDISADQELAEAFPELGGSELDFRRLRVSGFGTVYDWATFKVDIEFADVRDIKDTWFRFTKVPYIDHLTLGHMKEPFSLEGWASAKALTFMERALPAKAFWPSRNLGIRRHTTELGQRMTWCIGAFLNTGSFDDLGEAKDQLSDANGWNITGRITYLPWYEEEGRRLLHLGLSYTHQFRDENDPDLTERIRARPESFLTDDRLVDTSEFSNDSANLINPEFAMVQGPLSFQGEYFHIFEHASALGDPDFWGFYLYGSYLITGEHRNYGTRSGTFSQLEPKKRFRPGKGGWGALEIAARLSYLDLNSEAIRGGKETNFTAGLNWYLDKETRFMFNYIRAKVKDRETFPSVDDGTADIFQARFQINF